MAAVRDNSCLLCLLVCNDRADNLHLDLCNESLLAFTQRHCYTNGEVINMSEVANSIKKLRQERQLSQEQLAEQLHVTRQAVSNWENGKTQPDIDTLTQLASIFDVSVERIIYGKGKPHFHFAIKIDPQKGVQDAVSIGAILAVVISYVKWESIGWAILHGILNWFYVLYYIIKY